MKCPTCNAEMRPLLTGVYCPAECDKGIKVGAFHLLKANELGRPLRRGDRLVMNGREVEFVRFLECEDAAIVRPVR